MSIFSFLSVLALIVLNKHTHTHFYIINKGYSLFAKTGQNKSLNYEDKFPTGNQDIQSLHKLKTCCSFARSVV